MKIIKNWLQAKGLDICKKCRGSGKYTKYYGAESHCEICGGTGIIDWITKMRRGS